MITVKRGKDELRVPAKTLGARVLCEEHNNALSPLDGVGLRFFTALRMLGPSLEASDGQDANYFGVNGRDVERWMLKLLIGVATGFLPETKVDWSPPIHWLRVLYGIRGMPRNCGLCHAGAAGQKRSYGSGVTLAPLFDTDSEARGLAGIALVVGAHQFDLMMSPRAKRFKGAQQANYRPTGLRLKSATTGRQAILFLSWPANRDQHMVNVEWHAEKA